MSVGPVGPVGAAIPVTPATSPTVATNSPASGFGETIANALESVSQAEFDADRLAQDVAAGGETSVQELMVAMTKASLSVDMLVQVRNRAVEAYTEIMRMQL